MSGNFFAELCIKQRWLFFTLSLIAIIASLPSLKNFSFDASPRAFFEDDYIHYTALKEVEDKYGADNRIFIMLSKKNSTAIFEPQDLQFIDQLTEDLWQTPYSIRVDSLSNYQYSAVQNDDLVISNLFGNGSDHELSNEQIQNIALNDEAILNKFISPDGKAVAIIVKFPEQDKHSQEQAEESVRFIFDLLKQQQELNNNYQFNVTGNIISNYYNIVIATKDISTIIPTMFLLMFIVIGLLSGTYVGVVASILLSIGTTLAALSYATIFGITFDMLSINLVIISITITIAHCIHITSTYQKNITQGIEKPAALAKSLSINLMPVALTSVTTALGFLALNLTNLPPAGNLGNASALAALLALCFSYTLLPAILIALPKPKAQKSTKQNMFHAWANFLIQHYKKILLLTIIAISGSVYLAQKNIINDRFSEMIKEPHVFRADNKIIDDLFGGLYTMSYDLKTGSEDGIYDPEFLQQVDSFVQWLRTQPEIKSVSTITDIIKRLNRDMNQGKAEHYAIPESSELVAQLILLYEMSVPKGQDINNLVAHDKSSLKLFISMPSMDTYEMFRVTDKIMAWQQQNLNANHTDMGSSIGYMWSHLSKDSLQSSLKGSFISLCLISVLIMLVLRSLKYGLVSLLPNLCPAIIGFAAWYLIKGELNLGLTCAVIITIGIIVDDTIHFLSKYAHARRSLNLCAEDSIRFAFDNVGRALIITTITLAIGFALLAMSQVISNSQLGVLTAIIIIVALVFDFLMLPAILLIVDKTKTKQSNT